MKNDFGKFKIHQFHVLSLKMFNLVFFVLFSCLFVKSNNR